MIESWNKSAERIFGYTAAEMVGQPYTRLVPMERVMEVSKVMALVLAGRHLTHHELQHVRRSYRGQLTPSPAQPSDQPQPRLSDRVVSVVVVGGAERV